MCNFYLAKARNGKYLKIVEDVRVPVSDKLHELGRMPEAYIVRQRLVARFVNEREAACFLNAYNEEYKKYKRTKHDKTYRCPKCGSTHIYVNANFSADVRFEKEDIIVESSELESFEDTDRCRCLECGHIGRLYWWELKE